MWGMILRNGRVASGVGAACQMTNLLYWMTLHTPHRHRAVAARLRRVSRLQPHPALQRRATCFYNYMDLMVRNDYPRHLAAGAPGDGHPSGGSGGPTAPRPAGTRSMKGARDPGGVLGQLHPAQHPVPPGAGYGRRGLGKNSSRRTTPS